MEAVNYLDVPGARICYEVRGNGPVLVLAGSPMDAPSFAALAELMADEHTVVTLDPRGVSRSTVTDPEQDTTPELRADDVVAILDALGADTADFLGSSGGAVTGLALAERHPGRLRVLVAHEPPLLELLPDAAEQRAATEHIIDTFHREGAGAAMAAFMANAGYDLDQMEMVMGDPEEKSPEDQAREEAEAARFYNHELRGTVSHRPDLRAVAAGAARVVVGIGEESGPLVTHRTSTVLAEQLGVEPAVFPGEHVGFVTHPGDFAQTLRKVLAG
ncbi:alpha/beta hydrolase [Nonomuraea sp. NPDC050310]|uniref:alpha/beta fold hydrolase n=1 Tax=Nonomuraea sp. NPDC050310 TaxID=3154935 RepID=UPI0033FC5F5B